MTGCGAFSGLQDPFGAYAARITIEDQQAATQETIARYDHDARMVEAQNATWPRSSARAWANSLPLLVFLAGATMIAVVYIRWNRKVTLAWMKYGYLPALCPTPRGVPTTLSAYSMAAKRNQQLKVVGERTAPSR